LFRYRWFCPRRSYLEDILVHKWQWRDEGIVNVQPFHQLTRPLLNFSKRFYFVLGALQLAFMATFSIFYTPDWTECQGGRCDLNATDSWRSDEAGYPSWLWPIWPFVVLLYNGYMYFTSVLSELFRLLSVLRSKLRHNHHHHRPSPNHNIEVPARLLLATIDRLPACGFPVALFVWFYAARSWNGDPQRYHVTAVVLLLGWITTFMFFCGISRHIYVFNLVLKDIIVKDVIGSFMAVFVFSVIAFSSALYVLRGPADSITAYDSREINMYEVFASGLTMADYIKYTVDEHGRNRFFRSDTSSSSSSSSSFIYSEMTTLFTVYARTGQQS